MGSCSAGFKGTDKGTDENGSSAGASRGDRFGLPLTRSTDGAHEIFGKCASVKMIVWQNSWTAGMAGAGGASTMAAAADEPF